MNVVTILIMLAVAALLALAIRYIAKNGACATCEAKHACHSAGKTPFNGTDSFKGCSGKCSSCPYYEYELKAQKAKGPVQLAK